MAEENAGGTVNIISAGIDTAPFEADVKRVQAAIRALQNELKKLERADQGETSRASNIKQQISVYKDEIAAIKSKIKETKAAAEANEAFAKSSAAVVAANEATEESFRKVDRTVKVLSLTNVEAGRILSSLGSKAVPSFEAISKQARATSSSIKSFASALSEVNPATQRAASTTLATLLKAEASYDGMAKRRLESVRSLTAENAALTKMRDHYRALEEGSTLRNLNAEMGKTYTAARDLATGYDTLGKKIVGASALVRQFGTDQSRAFLGSNEYLVSLIPQLDSYIKKVGQVSKTVMGVDKTIKSLSLTSTEAGQMLAQYGAGAVAQFEALSRNASASSKSVKDSIAALYAGTDSPLTQMYRALDRVSVKSANWGKEFSRSIQRISTLSPALANDDSRGSYARLVASYRDREREDAARDARTAEAQAEKLHYRNLEGERQQHFTRLRQIDKDAHYLRLSELKKLQLEERAAMALAGTDAQPGVGAPVVSRAYGALATGAAEQKGLEEIRRQIEAVSKAQKENAVAAGAAAGAVRRFSDAEWEAHAAARGLAGSLGALWVTYGALAPLLTGAAIGSALKNMVQVGSEVEYQLTMIQAVGEGAKVSMSELSEATKGSVFSFGEATNALRILVQAGMESSDALQTLPTVLKLATIGEVELGEGALTVAAMLETFNLSVGEASRVTNTMAAAAASSPTSVSAMMAAMKQASSVSSQYSVSIEETSAALAVMAQRGIEGSAAGTAFRNLVKELAAPATEQAAKALESMGVSMFDANGNIKPLTSNLQQLADVAKLMSQEDRVRWFETFTNERSAKALDALVMDMDSFRRITEEVTLAQEGLGFVTEANAQLMTTTRGQWKQLTADFERVSAAVYEDLSPALREFVLLLRDVVNSEGFKESLKGLAEGFISLTTFVIENKEALAGFFAVLVGNTAVKVLAESLKGLAILIPRLSAGMLGLTGATAAFATANASAGVAAGSFAATLGGIATLLAGPWGIAAAAAVAGTAAFVYALSDNEQASDEAARAAKDFANKTDILADAASRGAEEVAKTSRELGTQIQKFLEGAAAADQYARSTKEAFLSGLRTQEMTLRSEVEARRGAFQSRWNESPEEASEKSSLFTSRNEEADQILRMLAEADRAANNIKKIEETAAKASLETAGQRLQSSFLKETTKAESLIERRNALIDAGNRSAAILAGDTKLPEALEKQHKRIVEAGKKAEQIKPVDLKLFKTATSDAITQAELMAHELGKIEVKPPKTDKAREGFKGLSDSVRASVSSFRQEIKNLDSAYKQFSDNLKAQNQAGLISTPEMLKQLQEASAQTLQLKVEAAMAQARVDGMNLTARQEAQNAIEQAENTHNENLARIREENVQNLRQSLESANTAYRDAVATSATNVELFELEWADKYGDTLRDLHGQLQQVNPSQKRFAEILEAIQKLNYAKEVGEIAAAYRDLQEATDLAALKLDVFSRKSEKRGIFGVLAGDVKEWSDLNLQRLSALKAELDNLMKQAPSATRDAAIASLQESIEDGSTQVHPILEGWGNSLGDYIANGIVYGFDQGESPAKAFANMLRREIYKSIASALSEQFKLSLNNIFGGGGSGAGGVAGGAGGNLLSMASNLSSLSNLGSIGGSLGMMAGSFGAGTTMTATQLGNLANAGLVSPGAAAAGWGAANLGPGLAAYGLGQKYGVLGGVAGGVGTSALVGGIGGLASGAGFMSGAGSALAGLGPAGWAAIAAGAILGSVMGNKKPSDKAAWATYDPTRDSVTHVGSMTGKKDPGQEARDQTAALAQLVGAFGDMAGITQQLRFTTGARDGVRVAMDDWRTPTRTPGHDDQYGQGGVVGYGSDMAGATKAMLDDLVDEGTLPQATIDAWRSLKTDTLGAAREADELVGALSLLVAGYDAATIERANLLQTEGEALESALGRMQAIESTLSGTALPGDAMAQSAAAMVKEFERLNQAVPLSAEALGQVISGLDLTTTEGRATYQSLMALAPAFLEMEAAQKGLYNSLLTDEQRLSKAAGEYVEAFKQLGVVMPENREGLLDLLGSFNKTTESGARLYAQILTLGSGFLETEEAARQLEDQRKESYRKLLSDEENLALDRKNLTDEFAKLGYILPKSKEELRGWIDALTNSADVAGTERERLQKIVEGYDKVSGGSSGFEKFIDYAGQTEEEARNTANGLIALIKATLDYQAALNKSTEATRKAREEAKWSYTGIVLDQRTEAIKSLVSPEELAAIDAKRLAESSKRLTFLFEWLGFSLPNSLDELRGYFDQLGGRPKWASTDQTVENSLLDLVAPFIDYLELKDKVLGVDKATSSDDAVERARDNLRAAYNDQRASLEKTRDAMRSFVDSLKQYRASLLMGDKSPLNPLEKYRLAQAEFEATSALAATGDEEALGKLQSVSDTLLDASRQMYASGAAYSSDFDKVLSALDAAGVAAGIEETLAQQSLEQLEIQVGALIDINESVLSVEQAIKELAEAFASGSTSGAYTQIADTYRTSLGRDPDSAGMAYWMTQHDKGTSVADIQTSIAGSAEAQLRSAYKEVLGRDPDSAGAAYWLTEIQKGLSMDRLEQSLAYGARSQDKAKALEWLQENGLPGFANGGLHSGGLRVVGERGVEIEATGPARYWNFNQTQQMLGGSPELLAEVRALRAEVAALRQQQAAEHREAVAANYDASDRNAVRISESTERVDRQRRTAERFA